MTDDEQAPSCWGPLRSYLAQSLAYHTEGIHPSHFPPGWELLCQAFLQPQMGRELSAGDQQHSCPTDRQVTGALEFTLLTIDLVFFLLAL